MHSDDNLRWAKRGNEALVDEHFGTPTPTNSFSGGETDHLFWNEHGQQFHDLDSVSGLAHPGDGRAASQFDFDRDGWVDLVVASANEPSLQLYRNQIGELMQGTPPGLVALRFEGGNVEAQPSEEWSAREGYGALVRVVLADRTLLREHRLSDGRASQHSATMLVGLGQADRVESLRVRWPSGREQEVSDIPSGSLVTLYEDSSRSPTGEPAVMAPYVRKAPPPKRAPAVATGTKALGLPAGEAAALNVLVAMSTHCAACKKAQPQLEVLRGSFEAGEVALYGVGTDMEEGAEELSSYARDHAPAYRVLADHPRAEREAVRQHILETFHTELTPVSLVTDRHGRLLRTIPGVPTVSDLRRLLESATESL